jgi:hypothetical protein
MKESRLIGKTLEQLNAERAQAGVSTPVVAQNARSTQAANSIQEAGKSAMNAVVQPGVNAPASYVPTVNQADPNAQALINERNSYLAPAQGTGNIQDAAIQRMRNSGMSEHDIKAHLGDQSGIQEAFNQVGTNSGQIQSQSVLDRQQQRLGNPSSDLADKLAAVDKSAANMNAQGNNVTTQDIALQKQSVIEQHNAEQNDIANKQKADYTKQQADVASSKTGTQAPPTPAPKDAGSAAALANLPPEYSFLGPLFQQQQDQINNAITSNQQLVGDQSAANNKAYGSVADSITEMKAGYKESNDAIQSILKDVKVDNEAQIQTDKKAAEDRLVWDNGKQQRTESVNMVKARNAMIAQIALSGGFAQDAGLAAVAESDAHFESNISNLQTELGIERTDLSAKFTAMSVANKNDYADKTITNMKDLRSSLERLTNEGNQNTVAWTNAQSSLLQNAWTAQTNLRSDLAKGNVDMGKEMATIVNQSRDDKRAQEQNGWNILNQAIDNYGHMVPKSIIDRVQGMLPKGTDIQDVINTPTFAERNSKRIAGAGGRGGSSSAGYSVPTGGAASSGLFQGAIDKNTLSAAIDRVITPKRFGGTAGEREKKLQAYHNRVNSGEDPAVIADDLVKDYWLTVTGTEKTQHDQRVTAGGQMDVIQGTADAYGISADNDGILGSMDSKKNWLESFVGVADPAYNDLRPLVGGVKAQITKANAGTAVSANELKMLKDYTPDMAQKGPTFFANVRNYKAMADYLDAKQAAYDLGLPAPALPKPMTFSGTASVGPGKFSLDDITNAQK